MMGPAVMVAECFFELPRLDAYRFDLIGSLAGTVAFAVMSYVGRRPDRLGVRAEPAGRAPDRRVRPHDQGDHGGLARHRHRHDVDRRAQGRHLVAVLQDPGPQPGRDRRGRQADARLRDHRERRAAPGDRRPRLPPRLRALLRPALQAHRRGPRGRRARRRRRQRVRRRARPAPGRHQRRRRRDRSAHQAARRGEAPAAAVRRSAGHGAHRGRARVPAHDRQEVRPRDLRAARLAHPRCRVEPAAARELPVHAGGAPACPVRRRSTTSGRSST